jgi:PAS domain S-box-containing protein
MKSNFLEVLPNPVIVYDSQWKISKINSSAIQLLGYSKAEELIGKHMQCIMPGSEWPITDYLRKVLEKEQKESYSQLIKHQGKDGKQIKILSQFSVVNEIQNSETYKYVESGFLLEEALEQNKQQLLKLNYYKILAENIPGLMMLLVDKNMEIQCSVGNGKIRRKKSLAIGQNNRLANYLPQDFIDILQPLLVIAFDGTSVSREFNYRAHFYSVRLTPLLDYESENLCVIILQNITETKIIQNKLKLSKEAAEAANEAKSAFVAKMSHEIRTPLNAIIGFTDQLIKTKLTKKQSNYLEVVNNSSRHLLSTIDDILVLSRIESGETEVDEEPFSIERVIKAVKDVFELRIKEKNLDFQINCDPSIKEVLVGDPAKIRQVLINLIGNAIKFTHRGGIWLNCTGINRSGNNLTIRFDITDSGIGIEANEIKRIFKPFHQVDNSLGRSYFGSGLGLTISRDLIKSMGGEITVKSTPGKGSTFSFTLALRKSKTQLDKSGHNKDIITTTLPAQVRILFADDDAVSRLLGKVILNQYKARCVFADSGEEAIEKFKPGRFDIVLLDINMPGKSGVDVAKHIRKIEGSSKDLSHTKIIAMTANVLRRHIREYLSAGMDDFILKPFSEPELIEKIAIHCSEKDHGYTKSTQAVKSRERGKDYDLDELLRITKGDQEYTLLMLDTFLDNGKEMLDRMQKSYTQEDYPSIAEAAHRLLPSVEQLGFKEAASQLKRIDARYLRKSRFRKDPELIEHALNEVESCIEKIIMARHKFS